MKCNQNRNLFLKKKKAAGKLVVGFAGALLCVVLAGCSHTDKAMPISIGKALSTDEADGDEGCDLTREITVASEVSGGNVSGEQDLYVYVCGAVNVPGVVVLPTGSRCNDALKAAGGFREDAARECVNLAEPVQDGMQLYFPTIQEKEQSALAAAERAAGLVDINSADVTLLCTLPGIGETKARGIVAYREQHGAFASTEAIMQVPGIKESAYSQIKDLIIAK